MSTTRGKFFVIDGTDGSGKATQTKLLVERSAREGFPVKTISFPRYGKPSARKIEQYLAGAFGPPETVDAKTASSYYAEDRAAAAPLIRGWLEDGANVVADRYVASNMGHQGSKISDPAARKEFFGWNDALEYGKLRIPRPDLNIILHVPADVAQRLAAGRGKELDGHERNLDHLKAAERTYLEIAGMFDEFAIIECVVNGRLLTPQEVHERVWKLVVSRLLLK